MINQCNICPKNCNVDRDSVKGFCNEGNNARIAKVMVHFWEEPIISGTNGSGTIFFSGCNLKCCFCQNHEISCGGVGTTYSALQLANLFKDLESQGVHNINLVTPTHFTIAIIHALQIYKPSIPIVWNTSSYEKEETLELLKGFVDIFLCDLKFVDADLSQSLATAKNYFIVASKAILKMKQLCPTDLIENGIMKKGIIIRHLILPTKTKDSLLALDWIKHNLPHNTILSIMSQYTPCHNAKQIPYLNQKLKALENKIVLNKCMQNGFDNVFCQDLSSASTNYIPPFKTD